MELTWNYDPNTRIAKCVVDESLHYETPDGGQTISKFYNNQSVGVLYKYGDEKLRFTTKAVTGIHLDNHDYQDQWCDEILFLCESYPDIVGLLNYPWHDGYKNKNGEIEAVGVQRGFGVNNPNDMLSINRLCIPSKITEWWDWDIIAYKEEWASEDSYDEGVLWRKNRITGQIVRVGSGQPPMPCCVFPLIHGPWPVDESDIETNGGTRLP
jgi:hypothetical protein